MGKSNLTIGLIAAFFIATSINLQAQEKTEKVYTDEDYDKAVAKGVEFLFSIQREDGSWEEYIQTKEWQEHWTGPTALCCYAILEANPNLLNEKDNPYYKKIEKSLRWMMQNLDKDNKGRPIKPQPDRSTYSIGLRANAWLSAMSQFKEPKTAEEKSKAAKASKIGPKLSEAEFSRELFAKCLEEDAARLLYNGILCKGGFDYNTEPATPEKLKGLLKDINKTKGGIPADEKHNNSVSQYGLLGIWAAKRCGGQFSELIPRDFYRICMEFWMKRQWKDGRWDYHLPDVKSNDSESRSMTTAGLASMYVCFDEVFANSFQGCSPPAEALAATRTINEGLKWLSGNFEENLKTNGWLCGLYYFYGVERVGLASGYKFFGKNDWYKSISRIILDMQQSDGHWGGSGRLDAITSYAILFLVRGRRPVLMTRLDYGGNTSSDWNNRPRALHNFCEYMNSAYETDAANWQIVTLESQPEAWHDAPILCITGSRAFTMDDDQIAKLRTYVNQGGTIFAIAECGGQPFAKSFKDICTKMFPKYEMTPCTGEHRLALPSGSGPTDAKFSEISNGVRPLVIFTDADLTLAWQTKAKTTMKSSFTRASDVIQYVTAMQFKNRGMGDWPIEAKLPENPKTIKVARVAFNGNCDPEPLAWQRFSRLMAAKYQIKVDVTEPIAIANLKDSKANLAVFYGTNKLELSAEEKTALKEFVDAGGKILFDSAGGSAKFYDSAQKIVDEIWGANNTPVLAPNDPIYKLPNMEIDRVYYRKLTTSRMGKTKDPQLMALKISDKPAVMLSREDITSGLLGIPIFTCDGYESERAIVNDTTKKKEKFESAFQMMRNIVVSAGG